VQGAAEAGCVGCLEADFERVEGVADWDRKLLVCWVMEERERDSSTLTLGNA